MKNFNYQFFLQVAILLLSVSYLQAQADDNIIWASVSLKQNIKEKTTLALTPIFRLNDNISDYQNMSIDYSIRRKLGKGWSTQLLGRTWFVPNAKNRQFIWLDVAYNKKFEKIGLGSLVRYHYAVNFPEQSDDDFIRWKTTFSFLGLGRVTPFFAIEPWFRLDGVGKFQRIRYQPGVKIGITDRVAATMVYWREHSFNLDGDNINFNMYVINLSYLLPDR